MKPKWCLNYKSGEYEWVNEIGFSFDKGEYVYNWDNSEFRSENEENDYDSFWQNN